MSSLPALPHVDTQLGLSRAGGCLPLYLRFLKRFPEDGSFNDLLRALERGDLQTAFLSAHTLKGLCAQLGITPLSQAASALCERLRPLDPAALPGALEETRALHPLYTRICEEIARL